MRLSYRIVRPLARIALKIYFKKIYLTGTEHLPKDKPIILAANHPTAFLEPCLLACTLPVPLHFIVRGDLFQKEIHRQLLESLHMIPMYRMKDIGIKGVKNNFSSLDRVYDLLQENKTILILAEGTTEHEKRLRPIRKGTARMALGAIKKYPSLEVQIVPIGVNYSDVLSFRSTVMLDIGPPMDVNAYLAKTEQHPAKTIKQITTDLQVRLEQQVVNIKKLEDEPLIEQLLIMLENDPPPSFLPVQVNNRAPLLDAMTITNTINRMDSQKKEHLQVLLQDYMQQLKQLKISDASVVASKKASIFDYFLLVIGYIPYLLGYFANFPPLFFGKWWADNKVKEVVFYASIKASFALSAYIVYFLFLLVLGFWVGQTWFWLTIGCIPLLGFFALYYMEVRQKVKNARQKEQLDKNNQIQLAECRANIIAFIPSISK